MLTLLSRRELGIAHIKTLQMAEDVLSVRVTADGKLLSVSLLDNTLKVFFADRSNSFFRCTATAFLLCAMTCRTTHSFSSQGVQIKICVSGGLTSATVTAPSSRIMTL